MWRRVQANIWLGSGTAEAAVRRIVRMLWLMWYRNTVERMPELLQAAGAPARVLKLAPHIAGTRSTRRLPSAHHRVRRHLKIHHCANGVLRNDLYVDGRGSGEARACGRQREWRSAVAGATGSAGSAFPSSVLVQAGGLHRAARAARIRGSTCSTRALG